VDKLEVRDPSIEKDIAEDFESNNRDGIQAEDRDRKLLVHESAFRRLVQVVRDVAGMSHSTVYSLLEDPANL